MYPRPAVDDSMPARFRLAIAVVEWGVNRSSVAPALVARYSLFDWGARLPELIRNDVEVRRYFQTCVRMFNASGMLHRYSLYDQPAIATDVRDFAHWLRIQERRAKL